MVLTPTERVGLSWRRANPTAPPSRGKRRGEWTPILWLLLLATAACSSDGGGGASGAEFETSEHAAAIVAAYADDVVVPTYELLQTRCTALEAAVAALAAAPSDPTLTAAREAWVAARAPWELSEAYLFGPVDAKGFDPALDSWPVNRTDLDAVLASSDSLTAEYVANLDPTVQGFHTAEYLLFGVDRSRTVAELGTRELEYLGAVVSGMTTTSTALAASWTESYDGGPPYAETFRTAGAEGNRVYPSRAAAGQEIVFGILGILDEVANGKIADPFAEQDVRLVESQFSFNSLTDFRNNLLSAENAYLARAPETTADGAGLSRFVAERDAELDARVRAEFAAALGALGAIPPPFRDALLDPAAKDEIEAAQAAIRTLLGTFQDRVLPLLGG